jgi:fatty acid desaturase
MHQAPEVAPGPARTESRVSDFLRGPYAPWLTHGCLVCFTGAYFALILLVPFWIAFLPAVVLTHRIGTLLHEYIHGIPFRRYSRNHAVVTFFDGFMLMFGTLEMFRVSHLRHHRWLNTDHDEASEKSAKVGWNAVLDIVTGMEVVQYLIGFGHAILGKQAKVRRARLAFAALLSVVTILAWIKVGRPDVVWKMIGVTLFTMLVPVSLRAAIEHYSYDGDPNFANEYKVWVPLFNLNRHIHHHEDPTVPWYHLKWRTPQPLPKWFYVSHWIHVYIKRDFVLMRPMRQRDAVRAK